MCVGFYTSNGMAKCLLQEGSSLLTMINSIYHILLIAEYTSCVQMVETYSLQSQLQARPVHSTFLLHINHTHCASHYTCTSFPEYQSVKCRYNTPFNRFMVRCYLANHHYQQCYSPLICMHACPLCLLN